MDIKYVQMHTREQKALGEIIREEWPDLKKGISGFEDYWLNRSFFTEALVVTENGIVIGGNYMTNHEKELSKFEKEMQLRPEKNNIEAEFIVLNSDFRNRGIGSQLMKFMQKTYLVEKGFESIILQSNIIESQQFYERHGGIILFKDKSEKTQYHPVWKKDVLSEGTIFMYTPESCKV
ncbi:GNAT family N-acetyltransferase [Candidatus Pacearchaeota archaeon]|nr:GNAT family N-acetyltransferase [Candidatus Pacearchaeota archaeon]